MRHPFIASSMLALAFASSAVGCDDAPPPETLGPADQSYTVRGRIEALRDDEIAVTHEAIPTFVSRTGEPVGMDPMTMTFYRSASLSTDGLGVGDAVEMTFEVRWEGDQRLTATALRKLPTSTTLELGD